MMMTLALIHSDHDSSDDSGVLDLERSEAWFIQWFSPGGLYVCVCVPACLCVEAWMHRCALCVV